MSYRSYTTEKVVIPSFIAQKIVALQYGQQDELEDYVHDYCFDRDYLDCGVEKFHAYDGALSLSTNLTEEEKADAIAVVCLVIAKWFEEQGSSLI